jgi:hypothetical protein
MLDIKKQPIEASAGQDLTDLWCRQGHNGAEQPFSLKQSLTKSMVHGFSSDRFRTGCRPAIQVLRRPAQTAPGN